MESIAGALEGCCWVCEQLAACWVWKLDRELSGLDVHGWSLWPLEFQVQRGILRILKMMRRRNCIQARRLVIRAFVCISLEEWGMQILLTWCD